MKSRCFLVKLRKVITLHRGKSCRALNRMLLPSPDSSCRLLPRSKLKRRYEARTQPEEREVFAPLGTVGRNLL